MSLKNLYIFLAIAVSCFFLQAPALAQDLEAHQPKNELATRLYRPQIEWGTGVLSYYGDIGHLGGHSRSYDLNWGHTLALKNKIANAFDLNLFFLFGHVSQTEYFKTGNINFKTDIKMGGFSMVYNFDNFLPKKRSISPYISLGFTSFEFNPKGDLHDANGNEYHYWNDGTIRRGPHTVAKDNSSDVLQRDYVYESDLRKLDDKKSYELRSFSIPVGAGALLDLTDAFTLRMGAEFHYTLTDNIDNIDSRNTNYASSKKGNDYLIYSSLGIIYNMHYFKNDKSKPRISDFDDSELEFEDEDNDGVADIVDRCPFTPTGVEVDVYGCPIDSDNDGVADYLDLEPNSAPHAHVDEDGVTLTEEKIQQMFLAFKDSVGDMQLKKSTTVTADLNLKRKEEAGNFKLRFENTSNLSSDELSKMLSIPDLEYEYLNGRFSYFTTHHTIDDAFDRSVQMRNLGFTVTVLNKKTGDSIEMDEEIVRQISAVMNTENLAINRVTFRIQIGAFKNKLADHVFANLPNLLIFEGNDGLTRYTTGAFTSMQDAAKHRVNLLLNGFDGAFVLAYRSGRRISLQEAGATLVNPESEENWQSEGNIQSQVNAKAVSFSIQIGSFSGRIPAEVLSRYLDLGNVRPIRMPNGDSKYVYGKFENQKQALDELVKIKDKGFNDAFVVGEFNNQVIPASDAERIKNQ